MNVVCVCVEPVDPPCAMRFPLLHHTSSSRCLRLRLCRSSSNRVDDILVHTPEHTYTTLLLLERRARERGRESEYLFPLPSSSWRPCGVSVLILLSVAKREGGVIMLLLLANLLDTESYV